MVAFFVVTMSLDKIKHLYEQILELITNKDLPYVQVPQPHINLKNDGIKTYCVYWQKLF
mgnify:CR=1 FL=1